MKRSREIKDNLRRGWEVVQRNEKKEAEIFFLRAHVLARKRPLLHSATHFSLAYLYRDQPRLLYREIYLGVCAPFASIRSRFRDAL